MTPNVAEALRVVIAGEGALSQPWSALPRASNGLFSIMVVSSVTSLRIYALKPPSTFSVAPVI